MKKPLKMCIPCSWEEVLYPFGSLLFLVKSEKLSYNPALIPIKFCANCTLFSKAGNSNDETRNHWSNFSNTWRSAGMAWWTDGFANRTSVDTHRMVFVIVIIGGWRSWARQLNASKVRAGRGSSGHMSWLSFSVCRDFFTQAAYTCPPVNGHSLPADH